MKNKEKFAKEIVELTIHCKPLALKYGEPVCCDTVDCSECGFYEKGDCAKKTLEWAESEYEEPKI